MWWIQALWLSSVPLPQMARFSEAAALTVVTTSSERRGDQVTRQSPLPVYMGSAFSIRVNGETLAAGEHAISVSVLTREIGRLHFDVQDTLV